MPKPKPVEEPSVQRVTVSAYDTKAEAEREHRCAQEGWSFGPFGIGYSGRRTFRVMASAREQRVASAIDPRTSPRDAD